MGKGLPNNAEEGDSTVIVAFAMVTCAYLGAQFPLPSTVAEAHGDEGSLLASLDDFWWDGIFFWSFATSQGVDGLAQFLY